MEDLYNYICKYCGKKCKNQKSLRSHERLCRSNPNRQESSFVQYNKTKGDVWNKGLTKETNDSLRKQGESISKHWQRVGSPNKGKRMSDEQKSKISQSRKKYLEEHPDQIPYLLNHSSAVSYPEQYFIELFGRESIDLLYHKQVGLYQLDFYNDKFKVYVEIDGEQHYQPRALERDKRREEKLKSRGWNLICRIRWSEWKLMDKQQQDEIIELIRSRTE